MSAEIPFSFSTSQNKSNPQSYQHLRKAWGSARISAECSKKLYILKQNRSLRTLLTPSASGFPLNIYASVCIYKNIYRHIHRFKQKGKKDEKQLHKTFKPKQNLRWFEDKLTELDLSHHVFLQQRLRAAQEPEVDLLDIWEIISWQFILTHSSAELQKLAKSTPTILDWFANSKAWNTVR